MRNLQMTVIEDSCIYKKRPIGYIPIKGKFDYVLNGQELRSDKEQTDYVLTGATLKGQLHEFSTLLINFGVCPATFRMYQNVFMRKEETVLFCDWACFDYDDGTSVQAVIDILLEHNLNHIMAGSMNHNKDKNDGNGVLPRFHVFIPTDEEIKCPLTYKDVVTATSIKYGITGFDESCKEIARFFAVHSQILSVKDDGENLNVKQLQTFYIPYKKQEEQELKKKLNIQNKKLENKNNLSAREFFDLYHARNEIIEGLQTVNHRNRSACRLTGAMKTAGFSVEDAIDIMNEYFVGDEKYRLDTIKAMKRLR